MTPSDHSDSSADRRQSEEERLPEDPRTRGPPSGYSLTRYEPSPNSRPLSELQDLCVCEGKWVEHLAAISTPVRLTDYQHPDDELWVLATMTQLKVLHESKVYGQLVEGELVRVEDLPNEVDLPDYPSSRSSDSEFASGGEEGMGP